MKFESLGASICYEVSLCVERGEEGGMAKDTTGSYVSFGGGGVVGIQQFIKVG